MGPPGPQGEKGRRGNFTLLERKQVQRYLTEVGSAIDRAQDLNYIEHYMLVQRLTKLQKALNVREYRLKSEEERLAKARQALTLQLDKELLNITKEANETKA